MKFELIKQLEIDVDYQGINISEFAFVGPVPDENLITYFFRSNCFTVDSRRKKQKENPIPPHKAQYLRSALNFDHIDIHDFRKYDKSETSAFLENYTDEWGPDDDFRQLNSIFSQYFSAIEANAFFVIDKDWFPENSEKLREPESWIFDYYFLIFWTDEKLKKLVVTEWTWD
jgi:hypothetical protein